MILKSDRSFVGIYLEFGFTEHWVAEDSEKDSNSWKSKLLAGELAQRGKRSVERVNHNQ